MSFEIEGKLHKKYEMESKSSSFQTREFVIEVDGTYPQYVKFQLTQDRCSLVDPYKEGEVIKVSFDLRGREWQGKYFTNLNAWRVEKSSAAKPVKADDDFPIQDSFPTGNDEPTQNFNDDLPF